MIPRALLIPLAILLFATSSRAEGPMSLQTSWENIPRCVGRMGKNAAMTIKNAPRGTKSITATLTFGTAELGGESVPLAENGTIPLGAIHVIAPCSPGIYRWTVTAEDADGRVLTTVQKDMPFP